MSNLNLKYR